jgi:precorrin-6Y C5,15-methyltransferase (decarboxylating)
MREKKNRALVFAGTTEGREIAEYLSSNGVYVTISVATEYGKTTVAERENLKTDSIRGVENTAEVSKEYDIVVDATHPYSFRKSAHIKEACGISGVPLVRVVRPSGKHGSLISVPDAEAAAEYLKNTSGNVLLTAGSNELASFTAVPGYRERIFARVLSLPSVVQKCSELGFEGRNLICMEGPYSEELNIALLKQIGAKYLVTKDSGKAGGFEEKISAAEKTGTEVILIGRPAEDSEVSLGEAYDILSETFSIPPHKRRVNIVGIGTGNPGTLTADAAEAIASSDAVIGAERMLSSVNTSGKKVLAQYLPDKIAEFIESEKDISEFTVLVSGDTGYYSGAKGVIRRLNSEKYDIIVIPGISSVSYFFSKIGKSWDDAYLTSCHGRECNIIASVSRYVKVFTLTDGKEGVKKILNELVSYGLDSVDVTVGQDFGTEEEKIVSGSPEKLLSEEFGNLCVALIENPSARDVCPLSIQDGEFIRGDAPMTKSEVRTLSVAKLKLEKTSVVYDIGAGTGSVSAEMALTAPEGKIFAIEKDETASALIELNKKKFRAPNITVIRGTAPEALAELPAPTHAFIGGTSGNLKDIVKILLEKNPEIRIVITSVTLETLAETVSCIKESEITEEETVCINVSKARNVGKYHLMTGQNPVYITVCRGNGK